MTCQTLMDMVPSILSDGDDETRDEFLSDGEEYSYIFTSVGWVCYDMNEFNDKQPVRVIIPEVDLAV